MTESHINTVYEIETRSFSQPWSKNELLKELESKHAIYIVAEVKGTVAGYAGLWHIVNEGQITNIAVDIPFRRLGVASLLLKKLISIAQEKNMIGLTLEVRVSNITAQNLYKKHGFVSEGIRKGYYDNGEDAVIMWKYLNEGIKWN